MRNALQEHIHIDYLLREIEERFITEEHGYVPNLDEYLQCFRAALPEKYTSGKVFTIEDNAFQSILDLFFKDITIQVGVTYDENATSTFPQGRYLADRSFFYKKEKKLYHPVIVLLYVTNSGADIEDRLVEAFAHELTHCYEDYQRGMKGSDSLSDVVSRGYSEYVHYDSDAKPSEKILKSLLYFLDRQEQHAYVGEIKASLLKGTAEELRTSEGVFNLLKDSLIYKQYSICGRYVERIRAERFNDISKRNMLRKFQEIYPNNRRVRNFHELSKLLVSRWERWDRKFKTSIGKIAFDIYLNKTKKEKSYKDPGLADLLENHWTNVIEIL